MCDRLGVDAMYDRLGADGMCDRLVADGMCVTGWVLTLYMTGWVLTVCDRLVCCGREWIEFTSILYLLCLNEVSLSIFLQLCILIFVKRLVLWEGAI